jgi:anti-anti-sigma factor
MLNLQIQNYTETRVIHLAGELNALSCMDLSRTLEEQFSLGVPHVVLDLSRVTELTSAAQQVIFDAFLQFHSVNMARSLALCGLNLEIGALLKMTGITKLVPVYSSEDDALRALQSKFNEVTHAL